MEIQEGEKRRAMGTKKEDSTKSSSWIPLDVTIEILLRLPAKSVVRFRCVSKLWSSTTTTPFFIKSFALHSSARPFLLSCLKKDGKRIFYSMPHQQDPQNPHTFVENHEMMLPKEDAFRYCNTIGFAFDVRDSICGLVSFENFDNIIIWNPTLRQHVTLPQPGYKITIPFTSLLGYDPIAGEHKVLCMSICEAARKNGEDPQIFTLGANESWWRKTKSSPIHLSMKSSRCINGVLYYYGVDHSIVSFDVRSEKFSTIKKPDCDMPELPSSKHTLINYKGRLGWIDDGWPTFSILWILEDVKKQEWSSIRFEVPFRRFPPKSCGGYLMVSGDTGDDELIYALTTRPFAPPFYAFYYYHLKKNVTRKVTYEDFGGKWFNFVSFPNHIESLVSLKSLLTQP